MKKSRFRVFRSTMLSLGIALFVAGFLQNCQKNISNSVVSWGKPTLVVPDVVADDGLFSPVAVDKFGNGFIVWVRSDAERKSLWTKAYTSNKGWESETQIGKTSTDLLDVQMAMNSVGDGIVLWSQFDAGKTRIQANTYASGIGWGVEKPIQTMSENASSAQIVMDELGGGIAVWAQNNGNKGSIHAASYRKETGWDRSTMLSVGTGDANEPQIAIDASGNAVVVWSQTNGTDYQIWANVYQTGHGWRAPAQTQISSGDSLHPQVALNGKGNAIVVWRQFDGTHYSLYSSRFVLNKGWGVSKQIENHEDDAVYPHLVGDKHRNAVVVWIQRRCIERRCVLSKVWGNWHETERGWGKPQLLAEDALNPKVAMYGDGEIVTVWTELEGFFSKRWKITASRYKFRKGWESDIKFQAGTENAFHPTLSTNEKGDVLIAWEEIDNPERNIWANWIADSRNGN